MITSADMIEHLMTIDRLNLGTVKVGQADLWADVLNTALPDVTSSQVHKALLRLAATRGTESRGVFLTPADLISAVQGVGADEKRERAARLDAAKSVHGDFTSHPAVTGPTEFVQFRRTVTAAFLEGADVEQAVAAGFAALGRAVPPQEVTSKRDTDNLKIGKRI